MPAVLLCLVLGLPTGALAYWTAGGAGLANATSGDVLPPTSVTAAQLPGAGTVRIGWERSTSPDVTGYRVERSTGGGAWVAACGGTTLASTTRTCDDPGLAHQSSHRHRVVAVKGGWTATSAGTPAVVIDTSRPTVTVRVAQGQANPTNSSTSANPIRFTVEFSEPVTGFTSGDVALGGTADLQTALVDIVPSTGPSAAYTVSVRGAVANGGTVIAGVPANAAFDGAGNGNGASTSPTGNSVTLDNVAPVQPDAPRLTSSESVDTGTSQTDNITNARSLQFVPRGPVPATTPQGTTVALHRAATEHGPGAPVLAGGVPVSGVVSGSGTYTLDYGTQESPADAGTYWYYVRYTDSLGNVSVDGLRQQVIVDRTSPTAPTLSVSRPLLAATATISGTYSTAAGDAGVLSVYVCGGNVGTCTQYEVRPSMNNGQYSFSYNLGLLGALLGTYTATAKLTDVAGNESTFARSPF